MVSTPASIVWLMISSLGSGSMRRNGWPSTWFSECLPLWPILNFSSMALVSHATANGLLVSTSVVDILLE